jgi:glycosyltransferase involved in cell wall biosynthesis
MKTVVIIPAYNSEKTIKKVIKRIPVKSLNEMSKVLVVNDGSLDKTESIVKELPKKFKIKVINHKKNRGYGAAQKTGFKEALKENADAVVILHSDGQYPPEMIEEFIKAIRDGYDIVGGSRKLGGNMFKQGMPLYKYIGNIILTNLLNYKFKQDLSCYHSGYKAYSKIALQKIDFNKLANYFYFDTEMLIEAKKNKLKIREIPIPTVYGDEELLN